MKKREEARKIHSEACNYAITPPKKEGGRWQTYVKDDTFSNGRRKIMKSSEDALLDELVIHYMQKLRIEHMTLEVFYPEWYEYKASETASTRTLRRHDQHWKKYYAGTEFANTTLKDMNCISLTKWANNLIREHKMTAKEFGNVKTILTGCLKLAKRMGIIPVNPWLEVDINKRLFRVVHKKANETQVYLNDELPKLYEATKKEMELYPECTNSLAILLNLCLGLRISELVALQESDIEGNYIRITRMETKSETLNPDGTWGKSAYQVVDYTKTHEKGDRLLYLTQEAREIITLTTETKNRCCYESEYLFCNKNGRTTSRSIANTIEKLCRHSGIPTKSSHKIRKTVASRLNATGVPLDEIRKILGHTQTATTLSYIFNPFNTKETEEQIENALSIGFGIGNMG
jgi:integrase